MRGDEARVVSSFCIWLGGRGWTVALEVGFWDVVASMDGATLFCEAKGKTSDAGLDIHTAYGQILCRQSDVDDSSARYALVVRDEPKSVRAALRAPARIRELLRISIYAVGDDGSVRLLL